MAPRKRKCDVFDARFNPDQAASDTDDIPFRIALPPQPPPKKPRLSGKPPTELQSNEFDARLDTWYTVRRVSNADPHEQWDSKFLKPYRRFQAGDLICSVGDVVYVMAPQGQEPRPVPENEEDYDFQDCWVAKILDCRAVDGEHVYLRVWWLYRPEDLPSGRQDYHADGEVVPSNAMQIINAESVTGVVDDLKRISEFDYKDMTQGYDDLFWRHTFNAQTGEPSDLRRICVCNKPANPDNGPLKCSSQQCHQWMHAKCVEHKAIGNLHKELLDAKDDKIDDKSKSKLTSLFERIPGFRKPEAAGLSTTESSTAKAKYSNVKGSESFQQQGTNSFTGQEQDAAAVFEASLLPTSKGPLQVSIQALKGAKLESMIMPARCVFCGKDLQRQVGHAILDVPKG